MRSSTVVALLAGAAAASPVKREAAYSGGDVTVLNYALTLEHLESVFYHEALKNYTQADFVAAGFPDPFYSNLQSISKEEDTHVSFLTSALQAAGAKPVEQCTYSFPATDPKTFLMLASVIEGVGVSAYLGAAKLISNPAYLTAAAQILPIESRHTAYIRKELGEAGTPQPFDTPIDLDMGYTLAAPFIVKCPPSSPSLPLKAFPSVALATTGTIKKGQTITLTTTAKGAKYAAFLAVTGPVFQPLKATSGGYTTTIPVGYGGQTYIALTNSNAALTDDTAVAGIAAIEVSEVYSSLTG